MSLLFQNSLQFPAVEGGILLSLNSVNLIWRIVWAFRRSVRLYDRFLLKSVTDTSAVVILGESGVAQQESVWRFEVNDGRIWCHQQLFIDISRVSLSWLGAQVRYVEKCWILGWFYFVAQEAHVAGGADLGPIDEFYVAEVVVLEDRDLEDVALSVKLDKEIVRDPREDHDRTRR